MAPYVSSRLANHNRKIALREKDTLDAIDQLIPAIQSLNQASYTVVVDTLSFRHDTRFKEKNQNMQFLDSENEKFDIFTQARSEFEITFDKYKTHFSVETQKLLQQFMNRNAENYDNLFQLFVNLRENGTPKKLGNIKLTFDTFRAGQLIDRLNDERKLIVS